MRTKTLLFFKRKRTITIKDVDRGVEYRKNVSREKKWSEEYLPTTRL